LTRVVWTGQAIEDVEAIREFIARDSPRYARAEVERIVAAVERLAQFPESGRIVPDLQEPSLREVIEAPYRIVYRLIPEEAQVLTVFRASRALRF
jgi:addiction module RelE/StbE family toxin